MPHTVLMGDPTYFHISGGANPFTRTWWGTKKNVNHQKAVHQWNELKKLLLSLGVKVHIIPPAPDKPGLVYPANAGVRLGTQFILSNLLPTRCAERPVYEKCINDLGLKSVSIRSRFEGEADFFPVGHRYLFTYGAVLQQRFVPQWGLPPWRRVYGFRSEKSAGQELRTFLPPKTDIIDLELIEESHYHGDTLFYSFGPQRQYLLAYLEGLAPESRERCRHIFKENLVILSTRDAYHFAANSFQVDTPNGPTLIAPSGISKELQEEIKLRGVQPLLIDVSEFLLKGGGSVKCMIGDLGELP